MSLAKAYGTLGNYKDVKNLLERVLSVKRDGNVTSIKQTLRTVYRKLGFPLHGAVVAGDLDEVNRLVLASGEVDSQTSDDEVTPLHLAAREGHKKFARLLVDKGANPNVQDVDGKTPLHWAVRKGHRKIVDLLLNKYADVNIKDNNGRTPFYSVAREDDEVFWQQSRNYILHLQEYHLLKAANCPLHVAVVYGDLDDVKTKMQNENVNVNRYGVTSLHFGARDGPVDIIEYLLSKQAELDIQDVDGETPLHWAVQYGRTGAVLILLSGQANPNVQNINGKTPLQLAMQVGSKRIYNLRFYKVFTYLPYS